MGPLYLKNKNLLTKYGLLEINFLLDSDRILNYFLKLRSRHSGEFSNCYKRQMVYSVSVVWFYAYIFNLCLYHNLDKVYCHLLMKCTLFSPGISISSTKIADLHHIMWSIALLKHLSGVMFSMLASQWCNV
jgi:hypothetical protein